MWLWRLSNCRDKWQDRFTSHLSGTEKKPLKRVTVKGHLPKGVNPNKKNPRSFKVLKV
jgi:hypothetical protein